MVKANTNRVTRTVVITGGSDGMGRAIALGRAARGDRVLAVGSNPAKGERLIAHATEAGLADRITFLAADLSTVAGNRTVVDHVTATYDTVDALVLAANRQSPQWTETTDGFESTFALYYLSRHILGHGLMPALSAGAHPVIVNIAGVGLTSGRIDWDDLHLRRRYRTLTAQLQAGRANDLLGVAMAEQFGDRVPYVLYHPGFTRSGDSATEQLNVDRGKRVPLDLKTLDPVAARRLAEVTARMLAADPTPT